MFQKMVFRILTFIYFSVVILLCGCTCPLQQDAMISCYKINISTVNFALINGIANVNKMPFTGTIFLLYPNTTDTAEVRNYLNGNENGEWRKYYAGGRLREKRYFTNGQKTGSYLVWWQNGQLQQNYNFEQGVYEGVCREWVESGLLIKEMNYSKGYEAGPQKAWWDNGKIKSNYIIKEGRRFGLLGTKNCINVSDSIFK